MKRLSTLAVVFFIHGNALRAQFSPVQQKAIVIKRMAELKHYSPRPVDDSFSVAVFGSVVDAADPRRLLFTNAEYQQLAKLNKSLDDELQGKGWNFLDAFSMLYQNALKRADSIISKTLQKPLDFSVTETLGQAKRSDNFNFSADITALANRWSRYLKYTVLKETYEKLNTDSIKKLSFKAGLLSLEPAIREQVKRSEIKMLKKILDFPAGFPALVTALYLNAVASVFDPHTNYFSPQGKEEFQSQLSTEAYFFGIVFGENESGGVIVDKLTPGGPAWKSGEIHQGDELLSLQWEGKEVQDLEGASMEDVFEIIDQSIHDKLLFRFRKKDGTTSMVFLKKEKSDKEENIVKSFVLKGEKKVGYILLPGFYTEWENETGSSCANDVAREIVKLKKEGIDGLVLDVRYNGGGSIGEAMEMTGIFIDEGPLAATKSRDGKLVTLKDPNRGTIYDGPMVLMVNGQSASASEMLAASLQDYNRAVIVGSTTYGKATMQQLFSMDTITSKEITGNEKGDIVKITIGKLFRLNGKTTQLTGVIPDVIIPDAFDGLEIGERFEKFPLTADTVKRNNYYKPLPYLPVSELAHRSTARIIANPDFQLIQKIIDEQQKAMASATRTIPLKAELFESWVRQQEVDLKLMKGEGKAAPKFTVENNGPDKQLLANDPYALETNQLWLENLGEDIYLQEAFLILTDLINLQKIATKN